MNGILNYKYQDAKINSDSSTLKIKELNLFINIQRCQMPYFQYLLVIKIDLISNYISIQHIIIILSSNEKFKHGMFNHSLTLF